MSRRILAALCGLMLLLGCSAPHDNPLDPDSDRYQPPVQPLPDVELSGRIRSIHTSRHRLSHDTYTLITELRGSGISQLDSAWVRFEDGALNELSTGTWSTLFPFAGASEMGAVVGRPFTFIAKLRDSRRDTLGPAYLFRVIEDTPVLDSPNNDDTLQVNPALIWLPFQANFPLGLRADVTYLYTDTVNGQPWDRETILWSSPMLPNNALSTTVPDSLPSGRYYWTLTVVDSFDNASRSKEGFFVVNRGG